MLKMKRILVPIDFTRESELALDWAIKLAKEEAEAAIILCHVLPVVKAPVVPQGLAYEYSGHYEDDKRVAEKKMDRLLQRIPETIDVSSVIPQGLIAEELERMSQDLGIDLIVMTTHGRRGLSHWVHGSIAEETVQRARCPVLVLHLNNQEQPSVPQAASRR